MYPEQTPRISVARLAFHKFTLARLTLATVTLFTSISTAAFAQIQQSQVIRNITQSTERLELTVNSSRILTLEKRIPRMVVNNPELVTVTPISANQVQLAARKPGVTQVNLWDEDDNVYTVDVMIYGDVRELELAYERLFPESSIKVMRLTNSLVLEGFVEKPESVGPIIRLAEDYAPKIINNISVGGVQQVMLKVRVMEVSRTKLRNLGVDFASFSDSGGFVSSISDLITSSSISGGSVTATSDTTIDFGVLGSNSAFFGFIEALQENRLAKVLADPTITTVSGRPAQFNVGGEIPVPIPQGINQVTIEYKPYGTQIDFVPIVLGNGNIRLEVRPRVSDLDYANAIGIVGSTTPIPALRVRQVDTGVELKAGQTLALAGLVQTKVSAQEQGIPYVSDLPYIGAAFRSVREEVEEIELLIMVTPELVDGMDPHQVPLCGPGMETVSPTNCQLYFGGHLEVPACGPCAPNGCGLNCANAYNNPQQCIATDGYGQPIGQQYVPTEADYEYGDQNYDSLSVPAETLQPSTPTESDVQPTAPGGDRYPAGNLPTDPSAMQMRAPWMETDQSAYSNLQIPQNRQPQPESQPRQASTSTPGLMGPIGYDMEK
ncbi:type II and III secretion system protein family protein [Bythopirellula goksoeyrii]|uniref:Type II secretion system protein D n=1 Tax=Bythopirellula goksoeyrii TaxID=1400387 RepID=A0A5B9QAI3_9BACT|nr:pilus assembly protein N-terminal domain-containing protein [Bythopirellula goksoeyrii]QEG34610.1 Type II secretion system protein D precursor [Bythopirellula goksoeyrii]